MNLLPGIQSSASGLQAERIRLEVISQNVANAYTTKTAAGGPYQRQVVRFETVMQQQLGADSETSPQLVKVGRVINSKAPPTPVYQPGHPDANENGIVMYPNVNIHEEMADMIAASHAFEANLAVIRNARAMTMQTLSIGKH